MSYISNSQLIPVHIQDDCIKSIPSKYPYLTEIMIEYNRIMREKLNKVKIYSYISVLDIFAYTPITPTYNGSYNMRRYWKKVNEI